MQTHPNQRNHEPGGQHFAPDCWPQRSSRVIPNRLQNGSPLVEMELVGLQPQFFIYKAIYRGPITPFSNWFLSPSCTNRTCEKKRETKKLLRPTNLLDCCKQCHCPRSCCGTLRKWLLLNLSDKNMFHPKQNGSWNPQFLCTRSFRSSWKDVWLANHRSKMLIGRMSSLNSAR